jgi:pyruvate-ferredoxin/flavodoxin oxidoreductase
VLAFYENELQKRFAYYEQMAGVSSKGAEVGIKKEPTET